MRFLRAISDVFHDRSDFDFLGRRRIFYALSAVLLLVGLGSLLFRGLNLGIDFEGGTAWQTEVVGGDPEVPEVRDVLRPFGYANAKVSVLGDDSIRVQALIGEGAEADEEKRRITGALAEYAGVTPDDVSFQDVGPTFGEEVTEKAVRALVVFLLAVTLYLTIRFELKMAFGAMGALLHDIALTAGVYSLSGFEVTPATVIAFLTILGYSLYDTVVVFDKVKEHTESLSSGGSETYSSVVNRSLNEVLMRSLSTSITTLLPVGSLLVVGSWILGAVSIRDFALALFVGLLAGTYSSIFVAVPILAALKEREPRHRALRRRVEARAGAAPAPPPVPAAPREPEAAGTPTAADDEAEEHDEAEGREPLGERAKAPGVGSSVGAEGDGVVRPRGRRPRRRKRRR